MKIYWKPEEHIVQIKQVTEKAKEKQESSLWGKRFPQNYFETKAEAIEWKRKQLTTDIQRFKKELSLAEGRLKRLEKLI